MTLIVQRSRGLLNIGAVFHTYFTKVIIVVIVTSLAAVVRGRALGWRRALIGRSDTLCDHRLPVCGSARAQ